jgi:hypothetical protein
MWLCSQRHISNPMRGSSFQIIAFIGLTASREENTFPITTETYTTCAIRTLDERPSIFIRDKPILSSEDVT